MANVTNLVATIKSRVAALTDGSFRWGVAIGASLAAVVFVALLAWTLLR